MPTVTFWCLGLRPRVCGRLSVFDGARAGMDPSLWYQPGWPIHYPRGRGLPNPGWGRGWCRGTHLGQLLPSLGGHLPILLTVCLVSQEKDDHAVRHYILYTEHLPLATHVERLLCARPWVDLAILSRKLTVCHFPPHMPTFPYHTHSTLFPPLTLSLPSAANLSACKHVTHFPRPTSKSPPPGSLPRLLLSMLLFPACIEQPSIWLCRLPWLIS